MPNNLEYKIVEQKDIFDDDDDDDSSDSIVSQLIKDVDNEFEWADKDTVKIKRGGIKHSVQMNAPQTFFNWLKINPSFSIREDWIFHYTHYNIDQEDEIEGFKDDKVI